MAASTTILHLALAFDGLAMSAAMWFWWKVYRQPKSGWLDEAALCTAAVMGISCLIIVGLLW